MGVAANSGELSKAVYCHVGPASLLILEIVRTLVTGEKTLKEVADFGQSLGKQVVVSADRPGYVVNRVLTSILFRESHPSTSKNSATT